MLGVGNDADLDQHPNDHEQSRLGQRSQAHGRLVLPRGNRASGQGAPDTTTIKMDTWALTFPRARSVYDQMFTDRLWTTADAQSKLVAVLRRKGLLVAASSTFGNFAAGPVATNDDTIAARQVSYGVGDLDDMTAALGRYWFQMTSAGSTTAAPGRAGWSITIREIGIHIVDSYDFDGDQFLGYWDDSDNSVSMTNPLSGDAVYNSSYREWRAANKRGGDFLVFSDIKRTTLSTPFTFTAQ
jgi:hypothetical protein